MWAFAWVLLSHWLFPKTGLTPLFKKCLLGGDEQSRNQGSLSPCYKGPSRLMHNCNSATPMKTYARNVTTPIPLGCACYRGGGSEMSDCCPLNSLGCGDGFSKEQFLWLLHWGKETCQDAKNKTAAGLSFEYYKVKNVYTLTSDPSYE